MIVLNASRINDLALSASRGPRLVGPLSFDLAGNALRMHRGEKSKECTAEFGLQFFKRDASRASRPSLAGNNNNEPVPRIVTRRDRRDALAHDLVRFFVHRKDNEMVYIAITFDRRNSLAWVRRERFELFQKIYPGRFAQFPKGNAGMEREK